MTVSFVGLASPDAMLAATTCPLGSKIATQMSPGRARMSSRSSWSCSVVRPRRTFCRTARARVSPKMR